MQRYGRNGRVIGLFSAMRLIILLCRVKMLTSLEEVAA